jgi:hypothetical protein
LLGGSRASSERLAILSTLSGGAPAPGAACATRTLSRICRTASRIAIDGEIFQDAWLEPIPSGSEVHVIPQIVGGITVGTPLRLRATL